MDWLLTKRKSWGWFRELTIVRRSLAKLDGTEQICDHRHIASDATQGRHFFISGLALVVLVHNGNVMMVMVVSISDGKRVVLNSLLRLWMNFPLRLKAVLRARMDVPLGLDYSVRCRWGAVLVPSSILCHWRVQR